MFSTVSLFLGTQSRDRTGMEVNPLVFETSASTNSAIWASAGAKVDLFLKSAMLLALFFKNSTFFVAFRNGMRLTIVSKSSMALMFNLMNTTMKKFFSLLAVVIFIAGTASAQLRYGVKGGANFSTLTESSLADNVKGVTGYQFGFLFQYKASGFAFQPEVLYSVKGAEFDNSAAAGLYLGTGSVAYETQNIEIPLNLQYGLDMGIARAYLQAGPYVSFVTGGFIDGDADVYDSWKDANAVNTIDVGVGVGAGFEYMGFQLAAKYDFGLVPMGDEQLLLGAQVNPFYDMKTRNLSVSLAYLF